LRRFARRYPWTDRNNESSRHRSQKAGLLYQGLGVKSLDELEQAAKDRKVRRLKRMSARTELGIISNIRMIRERSGKFPLGVAWDWPKAYGVLGPVAGVVKISAAGSVRRWREVVEDVDLLAASSDAGAALEAMVYCRVPGRSSSVPTTL
jgi:DNA polymerase (family 10)